MLYIALRWSSYDLRRTLRFLCSITTPFRKKSVCAVVKGWFVNTLLKKRFENVVKNVENGVLRTHALSEQ